MLRKIAPYIFAFSLLILGIIVGFFVGKNTSNKIFNQPETSVLNSTGSFRDNPQDNLFSIQTASIRGTITGQSGSEITVKNLNTQATGKVKLSDRLIVASAGQATSSPSANLSDIKLDKEASISLEKINGEYEVVSIQYTLPSPSLPPAGINNQ